ncbi:MAG: hypothetical protein HFJ17_02935 [Clostridia bacterium]|nr:hypothetical protein [Clostridia bacterium]
MSSEKELFDEETISYVSQLVESKSNLLNDIKDFRDKDKMLSICMEDLEGNLSSENKKKFDEVIKLMYQVEEYYITLAYSLGTKYGKNLDKM